MKFKKSRYLQLLSCICLISAITTTNLFSQTKPPGAVSSKYKSSIDWRVSDNFSKIDFKKWTYRKASGNGIAEGSKYAYIVNKSYLSLKGSGKAKKGGGLSGLRTSSYGFYITKFRLVNFPEKNSTVWHPAIWSSPFNLGKVDKRVKPLPPNWNEIDFMEFVENGYWHTQFIPRRNNKTEPFSKRPLLYRRDSGFKGWKTIGLEYHPTYQQLWEYVNGSWKKRGKKIYSSGFENTKSKIFYKCLPAPQYWVFSNKYQVDWGFYKGDSWMHVDYFYLYPLKSSAKSIEDFDEFLAPDPDSRISLASNWIDNNLTIKGLDNNKQNIEIFDLSGKLVKNITVSVDSNTVDLDVSGLQSNIYVIRIIGDDNNIEVAKFAKK